MEPYEHHLSLATAIAVGLLVGLEREQSRPETGALGGVRTYPMFALIGALATMLEPASMWLPLIALLGVVGLVAIAYATGIKQGGDHGLTTEASIVAVYLLGALAASRGVVEPMADRLVLVAGLGVIIAFLLSSKQRFHAIVAKVSRDDFYATVKFLIVAVIVLPLLPDRDLGPLGAINPRDLGLLVVTIAGLSFVGYAAMRWLGARRGLVLGAALGGLVSSTAVTISFANRVKQEPALAPNAAGAVAVAWMIMLVRMIVVIALMAPGLLATAAIPIGAMAVGGLAGVILVFRRSRDPSDGAKVEVSNPFELGAAVKLGLVFGAVLLITAAATHYFGDRGLYLAAALGGTTDVDAVTISSARLAKAGGVPALVATASMAIAAAVNTVAKVALSASIGGAALGRRTALVGALLIAAGGAGLAAVALA